MTRQNTNRSVMYRSPLREVLPLCLSLTALIVLQTVSVSQASADDSRLPVPEVWPHGPPGRVALFPASEAGWPAQVRDAWDTAPYIAFHKAAAASGAEAYRRGRSGTEPTPNQLLYDAIHYDLDLSLDPAGQLLTGEVTMTARVTEGPLSEVELDLASNMVVSGAFAGGVAARFRHDGGILTIRLDRPYATGEHVAVTANYSGNPQAPSFRWHTHEGQHVVWTLSQPFGSRAWWPSKDHPCDKADSVDVRVTVPSGMIAAGNGVLREQWDDGEASFAWWHGKHPIATYLVFLAVHPYHQYSDWYTPLSGGDPMEIVFYNYWGSIPGVMPVQARIRDMIGAFAGMFGEYPFLDEKYGHAEISWAGGMEHQTCTSLGYFGEGLIAHELAHMWWGDMVTCATFHDIWLNEGMATYSEALWAEAAYGPEAYRYIMRLTQYFGPGTIHVPDLGDWARIFDYNLSYRKASWIPHMLRGMFGDEAFFAFLADYREAFEYGVATTEDFRAVAEASFGADLGPFFAQWIYGEYHPIYAFSWDAQPSGGGYRIALEVEQVQPWQLFAMPLDVVVATAGGDERFRIENSLQHESYVLHTAEEPLELALDPDNRVLRVVLSPIPTPTFENDLLLVNGLHWTTHGDEVVNAYMNGAFWGSRTFDFWDCFNEPDGGYPPDIPHPIGHGSVPGSVLGKYRTVIWLGNNLLGDMGDWYDTPIHGYLVAGGNVLLMTRMAATYLVDPYRRYLGIEWLGTDGAWDCVAAAPGLTDMGLIGSQSYVSRFDMYNLGPESTLLYKVVLGWNPNAGLGVIRIPASGGMYNPAGGRFALLNGRPYRWDYQDLSANVDYILGNYMGLDPASGIRGETAAVRLFLAPPSPNPFRDGVSLEFVLPSADAVRLGVWDVQGRHVRPLVNAMFPPGRHSAHWDGRTAAGHQAPSGIYYLRLKAGDHAATARILRVR